MELWRFKLKLLSPIGTPWQSDTLFGSLCWQVVQAEGKEALSVFLKRFREGVPPFVLSDGFPSGTLPKPLLPWLARSKATTVEEVTTAKRQKKAGYLFVEQFRAVQQGQPFEGEPPSVRWESIKTLHASLDRNTNRTGGDGSGGELFSTEAWLPMIDDIGEPAVKHMLDIDIYARASQEGIKKLNELLEQLARVGYGKDKSVGLGQFKVVAVEYAAEMDVVSGADGIVSLSSLVPAPNDPTDGRWKIRTKYGKLGEEWALAELPFKRPLLQFEPGAVFRTGAATQTWFGSIVEGIAPSRPEVIQNCQTVAVPVVWKG